MAGEAFAEHLEFPRRRGHVPPSSFRGTAGGAVCGDLIRVDLTVDGDRVADAGFEASGCGAAVAAGSAVVALVRGAAARRLEARVGHAVAVDRQIHADQVAAHRAARRPAERRRRHVTAPPGELQVLRERLAGHAPSVGGGPSPSGGTSPAAASGGGGRYLARSRELPPASGPSTSARLSLSSSSSPRSRRILRSPSRAVHSSSISATTSRATA